MPSILQDQRSECDLSDGFGPPQNAAGAPSPQSPPRAKPDAFDRLTILLDSDPVDLGCLSAALRECPGLETFALRIAASLALSPDLPAATIEQAMIVLGTDRMRVLLYAWLLSLQHSNELFLDPRTLRSNDLRGPAAGFRAPQPVTPEMLYLAAFLHCLDSSVPHTARHAFPAAHAEHLDPHLALPSDVLHSCVSDIQACANAFFDRFLSVRLLPLRQRLAGLSASLPSTDGSVAPETADSSASSLTSRGASAARAGAFSSDHGVALSQLFERDFISLLPFVEPAPVALAAVGAAFAVAAGSAQGSNK